MLAPPSDFGYSPTHAAYHQQQQQMNAQQHQHSDERPKFLTMEQAQHGGMQGMSMMGVHEYHHPMVHHGTPHHHHMTPHAGMTPQHGMPPQHVAAMTPQHHQGGEYDHEPLVMNVAPAAHYYAPMGAHMLLVSSDYEYNSGNSVDGATPKSKNGTKRSREDLNLKEKKRMFKLNDRINQLKDMLEDAGVQTKKNKQSVLDNATYFIEQLRSDLMIAKQKAERAEKEAEQLKANANKSGKGDSNSVFNGCFQLSVTPRVVLDVNMKPITMNAAFQKHSGRDSKYLMKKDNLLSFLSKDTSKLDTIVKKVREQSKPSTVTVEAASAKGVVSVLLMASPVSDETGKTIQIEISLIPVEVETKKEPAAAPAKAAAAPSKEEATTDSDASAESIVL